MKHQAFKLPRLIVNVPTIAEAEEQLALAKDLHQDEGTQETYSNLCRASMVLNTKKIALTAEELQELKAAYNKEIKK